jgi:hypothetical protein
MNEQDRITVTNYFGGCPTCGRADGYRNAGKSHRFFRDVHKTSWCVGSNLFSTWRDQTEDEQRAAWHIGDYEEVEPLPEGSWSADPDIRKKELAAHRMRLEEAEAQRQNDRDFRHAKIARHVELVVEHTRHKDVAYFIDDEIRELEMSMSEAEVREARNRARAISDAESAAVWPATAWDGSVSRGR